MKTSVACLALALAVVTGTAAAIAQETDSASDATTYMDKKAGNQQAPTDNTLSNDEVLRLEHEPAAVHGGATTDNPHVSGSTSIYKPKSGSAAASEGAQVPAGTEQSGADVK